MSDADLRCLDPSCPDFGSPDFGEGTCPEDHAIRPDGPWRDGKLWVLDRKCKTCVFGPGNLMHLRPGRVNEMVEECVEHDKVFSCHKTLDGPRSVCRGLYDRHRREIVVLRWAAALEVLAFAEPPEDDL